MEIHTFLHILLDSEKHDDDTFVSIGVLRRSFDGTTITIYAFGMEEHQYQYSGSGTTDTNTGNTYYYTLHGKLLGTLSGTSTLSTTFMLSDTLGSVVSSISNTAGSAAVLGNQAYGPYGNQRYVAGSIGTNKGYTGQYNDTLTGLDYYNARYYDPVVGRFLSADTVQGNGQGMDPYAYVGGNPETETDPTGTFFYNPGSGQGARFTSPGGPATTFSYTPPSPTTYSSQPTWPPSLPYYPPTSPSVENGGCAYGGPAAGCFRGGVNTVQPTRVRVTLHSSFGGFVSGGGGVLCSGGLGMPCVSTGGGFSGGFSGGGGVTIDVTVNAVTPDSLCLNPAACITDTSNTDFQGESESGACSFTATTVVTTQRGKESIGTIKKGEKVLAYNPKTHKLEMQPVVQVWVHPDNDLVDLTLTTQESSSGRKAGQRSSEVVHTNKKHPFYTKEHGFVPVANITVGMRVLRADGRFGTVTQWTLVAGSKTMYNLEVAQDHTFTVGTGQWVVHNCDPLTLRDGTPVSITDKGFNHSFASNNHAAEWFGRKVTDADKPTWADLIDQAMNSTKIFPWNSEGTLTTAVLARVKYDRDLTPFVVQFDRSTGELVTAFQPKPGQYGAMLRAIRGKLT